MRGKQNSKQIAQLTQWVKHTCDIFPTILDAAEATAKHLRSLALWLQGKCALLRIFHFRNHHDAARCKTTRMLFQQIDISPIQYTFKRFKADSSVYIRLSLDRKYAAFKYIGQPNMQFREACRNCKHEQVQDNKLVRAELAIRWWHKRNSYHLYIPITLRQSIPADQLEAVEATFIQNTHPCVAPLLRKSLRYRQGDSKVTGFSSIWAKICRRRLPPSVKDIYRCSLFASQTKTWSMLCDLTANTKRRFNGM